MWEPYISDDGVSVRPVVYAEIHKPDERELYNAILDNFGPLTILQLLSKIASPGDPSYS